MPIGSVAHSFVLAIQDPLSSPRAGGGAGSIDWLWLVLTIIAVAGVGAAVQRRRGGFRPGPDLDHEWRARALMSELCPDGWTAEITVYGWGAPAPDDAPPSPRPLVSIDWTEYQTSEYGDVRKVVARRSWAPSVAAALDAMVADRRLDHELEQIERSAGVDPEVS